MIATRDDLTSSCCPGCNRMTSVPPRPDWLAVNQPGIRTLPPTRFSALIYRCEFRSGWGPGRGPPNLQLFARNSIACIGSSQGPASSADLQDGVDCQKE